MSATHYLIRIPETDLQLNHRHWNGNDTKGQRSHHGIVRLSESPMDLRLTWKPHTGAQPSLVGCFRLDLIRLLRDGFIREERDRGGVRLKFVRDGDSIYIRVRQGAPAAFVGIVNAGARATNA